MTSKFKIIVSDLHMGAGFAPDNPLEDFITDAEFADFVSGVVAESDAEAMDVELIVNGDMIEFLQVPATDTFCPTTAYPPEMYRSTSEQSSAKKMALVIAGHPIVFDALCDFVHPAQPRRNITIIKGNHDVNLYWGVVQDLIRQAVGATGERQDLLAFEARQVSREGIYVEHGNQYTGAYSRFDNFDEPLDPERAGELEIPLSSAVAIDCLNDLERAKWWVDAVKPIATLICYCFAVDFCFTAEVLANLLRVAPGIIWDSFADEGEAGARVQMDELRRQLKDETELSAMAERYTTDDGFRREFDARVIQALDTVGMAPESSQSPAGGETEAKAQDVVDLANVALRQVAQAKITETGARVVVFGHTHSVLCERLDGGVHVNTGTWVWWRDLAGMDLETWKEFYAHPEDFCQPHYLIYARVDYDGLGRPSVRVLDYGGHLVVECPEPRWTFLSWLMGLWAKIKALFTGGK